MKRSKEVSFSKRTSDIIDELKSSFCDFSCYLDICIHRKKLTFHDKELIISCNSSALLKVLSSRYQFQACEDNNVLADIAIFDIPDRPDTYVVHDSIGSVALMHLVDDKIHFAIDQHVQLCHAGSWSGESKHQEETLCQMYPPILVSAIDQAIAFCLMMRKEQYFFLHAAALKFENAELIFLGSSGSGKTTLYNALLHVGWDGISDDLTAWEPDSDCLIGLPRQSIPRTHISYQYVHLSIHKFITPGRYLIFLEPLSENGSFNTLGAAESLLRLASASVLALPGKSPPSLDDLAKFLLNAKCFTLSPIHGRIYETLDLINFSSIRKS